MSPARRRTGGAGDMADTSGGQNRSVRPPRRVASRSPKMTHRRAIAALTVLVSGLPAAAAPQATSWSTYERSTRADGTPSRCLEHRRGRQGSGETRTYVFQVFNDCNRRVQAVCDIAYTPGCDYGRDVTVAAHLDAPIEAYGETAPFGRFAPAAGDGIPGCFFARCTDAVTEPAPAAQTARHP
jgi:hypothetical protein